ncbi:MAG: metallophosphoesterase [Bacteroidales bacterium]|nr:metallophosphoesterase [Bacteroidales bacterium]
MRPPMFSILIILIILLALLGYVLAHIWHMAPLPVWGKWTLSAICFLCFCCEFLNFGATDRMPLPLASFIYNLGNKSVIIALYLAMAFLLLDIGRLIHIVPRSLLHDSMPCSIAIVSLLAAVFIYGSIHYHHKQRVAIDIDSHGKVEQPLTAVLVSDIHIGYHNRRADLAKWIDMINAENPDMVLIAGDIIDMSHRPVAEENMAAEFRRLKAPVFACLGNHEYYSGNQKALNFYHEAGITLLVDSSAHCCGITITGRDDRTNSSRKSLSQFSFDTSSFNILLDHQPYNLEETEKAGIDFQFSGHTHRGQIWPMTWIVDAMYECAWGSFQKGDTRYYVSSGLGIWGAKYRIGSQSEYVVMTISS